MTRRPDLVILGGSGPIGRAIERAAGRAGLVTLSVSRGGPIALDVRDAAATDALLRTASAPTVVYLVNSSWSSPDSAATDLEAVLGSAARHGVNRMLFASSAAVYGDDGQMPYHETSPRRGDSAYALAKVQSEDALERFGGSEMSLLSLRIFNVFGPGCAGSLVNRLSEGPPPELMLTADFVRDYVHVDDVADAFLTAAERPDVMGAVNIGRGVPVDNLALADAAGPASYSASTHPPVRSYSVADPSRARDLLSWSGGIDPVRMLRRELR